MNDTPQSDWSNATWEGSRRAQLRAALALSVRERLLAMEALAELAERIAAAPKKSPAGPSEVAPGEDGRGR